MTLLPEPVYRSIEGKNMTIHENVVGRPKYFYIYDSIIFGFLCKDGKWYNGTSGPKDPKHFGRWKTRKQAQEFAEGWWKALCPESVALYTAERLHSSSKRNYSHWKERFGIPRHRICKVIREAKK